ncbi:uncharacterized protein TRIADDRAFT_55585 [Trichoplax adhaerens]|uniref:HMG box domain-containing protein n=1 Tax=Trichoplax adhaerens TaxID=10228 RepID=B3RVA5_TRIAD|nr:hypothetical protein TRIADDRAFT_55585 [Trichoplax adhaerens]EDV25468.1 hypothetical protein TRIADDRAFT_55585 [Trichoplax adhaerens]|eukprot:XP_002111501.1 hypothetical protein TRIADDRAFT_55585 [Trichoplax adhaerens]
MDLSWNLTDGNLVGTTSDTLLESMDTNDINNTPVLASTSLNLADMPEIMDTSTDQSSLMTAGNKRSIIYETDTLMSLNSNTMTTDSFNLENNTNLSKLSAAEPQQRADPPSKKMKSSNDENNEIPLNPYLVFFAEMQRKIRDKRPSILFDELSEIIKRQWASLTEEEKQEYIRPSSEQRSNESMQVPNLLETATNLMTETNDEGSVTPKESNPSPEKQKNEIGDDGSLRCIRAGCNNIASGIQLRGGITFTVMFTWLA